MKTIYIIEHYSSEPKYGGFSRQYNFANELSNHEYNVVVISSTFSHYTHSYFSDEKVFVNELKPNFHYVYLRTPSYKANNGLGRIVSMIFFLFAVLANEARLVSQYGRPDVVIGSSIHPLAWVAAEIISRKYRSLFCAEVRDFWPRIWVVAGERSRFSPVVMALYAIEKHAFKRANRVIHTMKHGDGYICGELGISKEKTFWIGQPMDCGRFNENKMNKEKIPEKIRDFIKDSFVCTFAGYYMIYEGVYVMLGAAKLLKEKGLPIRMVFVGSGKEKDGMLKYVKDNALDNVLIYDRIDKEIVPALLSNSAVCMAHLEIKNHKDVYKYGASKNKVIEYLYSGACTVYGASYSNEVNESKGGFCFEPYDEQSLADVIEKIYYMPLEERIRIAQRGRKYIEREHDVKVLTKKLESVISMKNC